MVHQTIADSTGRSFLLSDLTEALFRHKKKVTAFVLTVALLATGILLYAPRQYRSEARLLLQIGRESVRLDPTATTGQTIGIQQSGRASEVATAKEVLQSRGLIEQVVDRLTPEVVLGESGPGEDDSSRVADAALAPLRYAAAAIKSIDPISSREEAIIAVERNFKVDAEHDSTVLVLTYDAKTAPLAQHVMQAIVDVFREEHVRLHQTSGSKTFFERQRDELEQQLVGAENALREAKTRMGLASIESRRNTVESRLSTIELTRMSTIQEIAAASGRAASLRAEIAALPQRLHTRTKVMPNTGADELRSQLYTLQVKLLDLEAKYNADHPLVQTARAQVEEAKHMVEGQVATREETTDSINENHRELSLDLAQFETELAGLDAKLKELDGQREAALADLKQLNEFDVELDRLERAVSLANSNYFRYSSNLEEARIDDELNAQRITNVAIAQNATLAEKPVSPSKLMVVALSTLLATAGTLALVLASEKVDTRLRTEEQIEQALRLPVVAAVPEGRAYGAIPSPQRAARVAAGAVPEQNSSKLRTGSPQ